MEQTLAKLDAPSIGEEAIRALCYPDLHYRNEYYFNSLPVYQRLVNLALHHGSERILELGAGLSTALWSRYAHRTGAEVTTIDADFEPMWSYVDGTATRGRAAPATDLAQLIHHHVRLLTGVTVSSQQLREFYESEHENFGGVLASSIAETIDNLSRPAPDARINRVRDTLGTSDWSAQSIFIADGRMLRFPKTILDALSPSGRFAKDVAFLDQHPLAILDPEETWDLIFFDSGEYSSCIEWLMLKDRIEIGGLAAFHDIFFPKSVKNFLPCAAIAADPNWKIVLIDDSTIQGLLIAQRLN
jgi:hypothetical protein